ncbi:hypothetical protein FEM03_14850 [Phragmitibacter flavus]|uniref:Uncharacterized protein n=1 Tax=Phragmitibacter flavus TaxID=2576071 RepID=A0A5R8KCP4_9BACT|nr:hypothetical protein FEM03_14850 [Phragmitibacter flavus]
MGADEDEFLLGINHLDGSDGEVTSGFVGLLSTFFAQQSAAGGQNGQQQQDGEGKQGLRSHGKKQSLGLNERVGKRKPNPKKMRFLRKSKKPKCAVETSRRTARMPA